MMTGHEDPIADVLSLLAERASAARDRMTELRKDITRELECHPFRTLALSAGAGYLLAGGLFSRLTLRLISFGARLAVLPLFAAAIANAGPADTPISRTNSRRPRNGLAEPQT